jgi:benzodiazapine receptor
MKKMQFFNIITLLLMLVVNALANALPINGITTGAISDSFPVFFTPAGYVFSIWGLIYIGLIAFGIYQALPGQRENPRLLRLGPWFAISNLLNTAWIFLWQYGYFTLTLFVMLGLLASLLVIFRRLALSAKSENAREAWLVNIPFSIYLGWISVATIANFSISLYDLGFRGGPLTQQVWTIAVILVATILGLIMIWQQRQIAYPLVLVWAFIGIVVKQSAIQPVVIAAAVAALLIAVMVILKTVSSMIKINSSNNSRHVV